MVQVTLSGPLKVAAGGRAEFEVEAANIHQLLSRLGQDHPKLKPMLDRGVAVEYPTVTTITVDLIKGWTIEWPRLEKEDFIMTIGSTRPLEDAARIAYRELIRWMVRDYGFDQWDAYMMLSQCGMVRLGNFVDPKYTVGAAIRKKFLSQ